MRKKRDYKAEYARRIELAKVRGLSRSQGAGHPRKGEFTGKQSLQLRSGDKRYIMLKRIQDMPEDKRPELIELYKKAEREKWKKRKGPTEERTSLDVLIRKLNEDDEYEYDPGPSPTM